MTDFEQQCHELIKQIVLRNIDREQFAVFLFGSRANHSGSHSSDFDIGFLGEKSVPLQVFSRIYEEVEGSIVPFHVDLVNFNSADEAFKEIALQNIELWNSPKHINVSLVH